MSDISKVIISGKSSKTWREKHWIRTDWVSNLWRTPITVGREQSSAMAWSQCVPEQWHLMCSWLTRPINTSELNLSSSQLGGVTLTTESQRKTRIQHGTVNHKCPLSSQLWDCKQWKSCKEKFSICRALFLHSCAIAASLFCYCYCSTIWLLPKDLRVVPLEVNSLQDL